MVPTTPVLMVALVALKQYSQAGPLPPVAIGQAFWANSRQAPLLAGGGLAEYAPNGTTAPPPEPPHTAYGVPGLGTGVSNCSH
jgi:hypothetical protein